MEPLNASLALLSLDLILLQRVVSTSVMLTVNTTISMLTNASPVLVLLTLTKRARNARHLQSFVMREESPLLRTQLDKRNPLKTATNVPKGPSTTVRPANAASLVLPSPTSILISPLCSVRAVSVSSTSIKQRRNASHVPTIAPPASQAPIGMARLWLYARVAGLITGISTGKRFVDQGARTINSTTKCQGTDAKIAPPEL